MFYKLKRKIEGSGVSGIVERLSPDFDTLANNTQGDLTSNGFPDFEPIFSKLILKSRSKETDFINDNGSIGGIGFIVSQRAMSILREFNLPQHKFYPLIYMKRIEKETFTEKEGMYYWFQLVFEKNYDWIDFEKSRFYTCDTFHENKESIQVSDKKLLVQITEIDETYLEFEELVFNSKYSIENQDLFMFRFMWGEVYISQRLKDRLEKEKITGVEPFLAGKIFP